LCCQLGSIGGCGHFVFNSTQLHADRVARKHRPGLLFFELQLEVRARLGGGVIRARKGRLERFPDLPVMSKWVEHAPDSPSILLVSHRNDFFGSG